MAKRVVGQDPNAHVFYQVDWKDWLTNRGFIADGSEIVSAGFVVESPGVKTHEDLTGSIATVWVKNVPLGRTLKVVNTIIMPAPVGAPGGTPNVTDDFTFSLKGEPR